MQVNKSVKHIFEFQDVRKNVPHPFTQGERAAVITDVTLMYQDYDDPMEEPYFDYTFRGYSCRAGGSIDRRQKRPGPVSFTRTLDTWLFIRELLQTLPPTEIVNDLLNLVQLNCERAVEREQEQIKKLMT